MFLSNTHNFIFFSIPRTGTTSILAALRATLPWVDRQQATDDDLRTGNFSPEHRESSLLRKHTMPHELRSILGDDLDRYFKLAFVRNPWDWLVSTYFFARSIPLDILIMPDGRPAANRSPLTSLLSFATCEESTKRMSFASSAVNLSASTSCSGREMISSSLSSSRNKPRTSSG